MRCAFFITGEALDRDHKDAGLRPNLHRLELFRKSTPCAEIVDFAQYAKQVAAAISPGPAPVRTLARRVAREADISGKRRTMGARAGCQHCAKSRPNRLCRALLRRSSAFWAVPLQSKKDLGLASCANRTEAGFQAVASAC
jgi:hypothetical protein